MKILHNDWDISLFHLSHNFLIIIKSTFPKTNDMITIKCLLIVIATRIFPIFSQKVRKPHIIAHKENQIKKWNLVDKGGTQQLAARQRTLFSLSGPLPFSASSTVPKFHRFEGSLESRECFVSSRWSTTTRVFSAPWSVPRSTASIEDWWISIAHRRSIRSRTMSFHWLKRRFRGQFTKGLSSIISAPTRWKLENSFFSTRIITRS